MKNLLLIFFVSLPFINLGQTVEPIPKIVFKKLNNSYSKTLTIAPPKPKYVIPNKNHLKNIQALSIEQELKEYIKRNEIGLNKNYLKNKKIVPLSKKEESYQKAIENNKSKRAKRIAYKKNQLNKEDVKKHGLGIGLGVYINNYLGITNYLAGHFITLSYRYLVPISLTKARNKYIFFKTTQNTNFLTAGEFKKWSYLPTIELGLQKKALIHSIIIRQLDLQTILTILTVQFFILIIIMN